MIKRDFEPGFAVEHFVKVGFLGSFFWQGNWQGSGFYHFYFSGFLSFFGEFLKIFMEFFVSMYF